jgi:hypothetical protein
MIPMTRTVMQAVRATAGLLVFTCPLVASGPARAQNGTLVIADFDGEKVQTASGLLLMTIADEQFGGTSEAQLSLIHPGANASRGALRISFRVTNEFPAPFAGAWAMLGAEGLATDLSAYRGVRFHVRSTNGGAFTAGILQYSNQSRRYLAPFEAGAEWTLVELPFDKFRQETPPGTAAADPSGLVPKDVTSIGFMAAPQRRGQFDLDVDRLELYR